MAKWTKDQILHLLDTNPNAIPRAVVTIYNLQTDDEKVDETTTHSNGVGFNGVDAHILSSFAKFYLRTGFLTPKQRVIADRKIRKYAGQLVKIANRASEAVDANTVQEELPMG